jgi:hypothetical protein
MAEQRPWPVAAGQSQRLFSVVKIFTMQWEMVLSVDAAANTSIFPCCVTALKHRGRGP